MTSGDGRVRSRGVTRPTGAPCKPAGAPIWKCRRCGRTVDPRLREAEGLCLACGIASRSPAAPTDELSGLGGPQYGRAAKLPKSVTLPKYKPERDGVL
jgi:hypothetical protein